MNIFKNRSKWKKEGRKKRKEKNQQQAKKIHTAGNAASRTGDREKDTASVFRGTLAGELGEDYT